jgi:hypothetical protein
MSWCGPANSSRLSVETPMLTVMGQEAGTVAALFSIAEHRAAYKG